MIVFDMVFFFLEPFTYTFMTYLWDTSKTPGTDVYIQDMSMIKTKAPVFMKFIFSPYIV